MMKNAILTLTFLLFLGTTLWSQRTQAVYAELLGTGLIYSINYDTRLSSRTDGIGLRLGLGYFKREGSSLSVPLQMNYLFGKSSHKIETGVGVAAFFQNDGSGEKEQYFFPSATLMYRFQPEDQRLIFRAGWSPIFAPLNEGDIISAKVFWYWPGLALGFRF